MTKTFLLAGLATLASASAHAVVIGPAILVPEPTSLLLLASGIGVLATRFRRR